MLLDDPIAGSSSGGVGSSGASTSAAPASGTSAAASAGGASGIAAQAAPQCQTSSAAATSTTAGPPPPSTTAGGEDPWLVFVSNEYLHVYADDGAYGQAPQQTVPPRPGTIEVPVSELTDWLAAYQADNNVDLVLRRVNGTCSRTEFEQCVQRLVQQVAATDEQQQQDAASALLAAQVATVAHPRHP